MCSCVTLKTKINVFFLSNRKLFNTWVARTSLWLPFSQYTHRQANTHTHTDSVTHTHTHTGCKTSFRPRGYEFSSLFHFHSPVSSFSRLLRSLPLLLLSLLFLFQPYCFSRSLHRSFFLFLFQAHCFSFSLPLSYINPLSLTRSVSLPQASCVYISVVYFYKCQTVFLPSVYWSTEREGDREREAGRKGGKAATRNGAEKRDIQREKQRAREQEWGERRKKKAG